MIDMGRESCDESGKQDNTFTPILQDDSVDNGATNKYSCCTVGRMYFLGGVFLPPVILSNAMFTSWSDNLSIEIVSFLSAIVIGRKTIIYFVENRKQGTPIFRE